MSLDIWLEIEVDTGGLKPHKFVSLIDYDQ
jgi:hypothetical protein